MLYDHNTKAEQLLCRREQGANVTQQLKICMLRRFRCTNTVQDDTLMDIFIAKNGYTFASGHYSNEIKIWELGSKLQLIATEKSDNLLTAVTIFAHKNRSIPATVSLTGTNQVHLQTYSGSSTSGYSCSITVPVPDSSPIITMLVSADGKIGICPNVADPIPWNFAILDLHKAEVIESISTCPAIVHGISNDGSFAVFFNKDGSVLTWSHATKKTQCKHRKEKYNGRSLFEAIGMSKCAVISNDGNTVIAEHKGEYLAALDIDSNKYLDIPCPGRATCLALCDDNAILVSGHNDGGIIIWSFDISQESYTCLFASPAADKHHAPVKKISIATNKAILSCDTAGELKIWQPG